MFFASSLQLATIMVYVASYIRYYDYYHQQLASRTDANNEYDFIIVGGGTAGAVIASRLSEISSVSVLLLEEGGAQTVTTDIPAMDILGLLTPEFSTAHFVAQQKDACRAFPKRSIPVIAPKILGGASTLNGMVYNRGGSDDYNGWARDYNCTGWSYEEVLPYFKKSENNQNRLIYEDSKYHSTGGLLGVSSPDLEQTPTPYKTVAKAFKAGVRELGYDEVDINSEGNDQIGVAEPQRTILDGRRQSTATAYLQPYADRDNLHILTGAKVTKILFGKSRDAQGVEVVYKGNTRSVYANKEIIISAGAINSPKILMLSGVGPAEDLKQLGINVVANLPVGQRLQDRTRVAGLDFTVNTTSFTFWEDLLTEENLSKFYLNQTGPLSNVIYAHQGAMLNYKAKQDVDTSQRFNLFGPADVFIEPTLLGNPIGILSLKDDVLMSSDILQKYYGPHTGENVITIPLALLHVKSRGYIKLKSKNHADLPIVNPQYLSNQEDVDRLVEAFLIGMQLEYTKAFRDLGATPYPEVLPGCERFLPKFSRGYAECLVRTLSASELHLGSSCPMGGNGDKWAVLDPRLRVQGGVKKLRVADASVMPFLTASNLMAPVIMIAEKVSDMIKQDNGL